MKHRLVTPFQILILVLSIYVVGALMADLLLDLPDDISTLLGYLDNIVCFFFFLDFWMRLQQAESKRQFMRWGWIDLLASIPAGGFLVCLLLLSLSDKPIVLLSPIAARSKVYRV